MGMGMITLHGLAYAPVLDWDHIQNAETISAHSLATLSFWLKRYGRSACLLLPGHAPLIMELELDALMAAGG